MKLERNYIGIWGSGVKITKASYQIIKWYVPKKKAQYLIFYESLCSEIGKKLHIFMKAYVVELERNHIGIWGLGATAPRSQQHFKESDKMEA